MKTQFPNLHCASEAAIIDKVIEWALSSPERQIALFDGEEESCPRTRDIDAIRKEVAITDHTSAIIYDMGHKHLGSVLFIHGNGEDVLSDYSDNKLMDQMWEFVQGECGL
jgi:hypothetical protein